MEGMSVEDKGKSVRFCVFMYNVQPGVTIDYATGNSSASNAADTQQTDIGSAVYILNTSTRKFHLPSCASAGKISAANKKTYTGTRESVLAMGYEPCKNCNP